MSRAELLQVAAMLFVAAVWGASVLAKKRPDIRWLRPFRDAWPQPTAEQRRTLGRRMTMYIGAELILIGLCIPLGYIALTVMMFHDFTRTGIVLTWIATLLCMGLGFAAIWQSRR